MCNLHSEVPKGDLERYVRKHMHELWLPGLDPTYAVKPVGPFGSGLFVVPEGQGLRGVVGQWGLIRPRQPERIQYKKPKLGAKPDAKGEAIRTNNARLESIDTKRTFSHAWRIGRRCLVPCTWYQEPNWETGKNIWWQLKRADGEPWMIAGLYDEDWHDKATGEIVPSYTIITMNCTGHPLLGRLHKPETDPVTKEVLPADKQDKRSLVHVDPADWDQWLNGSEGDARALLKLQPAEVFDQADALRTDAALAQLRGTSSLF